MKALIQPHLEEIKMRMQEQFGTQIDLSMQQQDGGSGNWPQPESNPVSTGNAGLRGLNEASEKQEKSAKPERTIRSFGFNNKEWTA
jgi:hypothetical protein